MVIVQLEAGKILDMKGVVLGSSQWIFCPSAFSFNCLHPNISIQGLHTVLCSILVVLTRRIWLMIKRSFSL